MGTRQVSGVVASIPIKQMIGITVRSRVDDTCLQVACRDPS